MSLFNKRGFRLAVGIIFLFLLAISVLPNLYLYTSSDGVVNARTTTLTSPIEGVLHFKEPIKYGKHFKSGELIGTVDNDRVNKSFLYELNTEKTMLESRIVSMEERIKRYTELKKSLEENLAKYQKFSAKQLELLIRQEEFKLTEEKAENERAKKEYEANKTLAGKEAINRRELERTESNYLKSTERLNNIQSKLDELKNSLEAVQTGVFLGDGHNDSPYSKQRADQMVIEISLAQTAVDEAKSRIAGIEKQIEVEKARIAKAERFEIIAPFEALAWRLPIMEGSTVVIDSEIIVLLDCSSIFLDIALSESQFANVAPGDKIQYRLIGDIGYKTAEVVALRGSGAQLGDKNLAAEILKDPKREFRIWAKANAEDLELSPENFYQVGRRIEVKLPRKWHLVKSLHRLIDVF